MTAATESLLRMMLDDASGDDEMLSTSDYTLIVGVETELYRAASFAARAIASQFAKKVEISAGPVKIANQEKFEHYRKLADDWDFKAGQGGGGGDYLKPRLTGVSISEMEAADEDTDRVKPSFGIGKFETSDLFDELTEE